MSTHFYLNFLCDLLLSIKAWICEPNKAVAIRWGENHNRHKGFMDSSKISISHAHIVRMDLVCPCRANIFFAEVAVFVVTDLF